MDPLWRANAKSCKTIHWVHIKPRWSYPTSLNSKFNKRLSFRWKCLHWKHKSTSRLVLRSGDNWKRIETIITTQNNFTEQLEVNYQLIQYQQRGCEVKIILIYNPCITNFQFKMFTFYQHRLGVLVIIVVFNSIIKQWIIPMSLFCCIPYSTHRGISCV